MKDINNEIEIDIIEPDNALEEGEVIDVKYVEENCENENKFIKFLKKIFK